MDDPTLATDMATLATLATDAIDVLARRRAVRRVAEFAGGSPRFVVKLTDHFDWDRLRVNVTHRVSPGLVRWR